jgi:hypothetical protein
MAFNRRAQIGLLLAASAIPVVVAATKQCVQLQLPIFVNATNEYYDIPRVDNDIDAVQWALDFSVHNQIAGKIIASVPISKTYDISAELCVPTKKTDKSDILQIAVHGNAWDKRYVVGTSGSSCIRSAIFQILTLLGWQVLECTG